MSRDSRVRPHVLSLRLTAAECAALERAAGQHVYTPSGYARLLMLWALDLDQRMNGWLGDQLQQADPVGEARRALAEAADVFGEPNDSAARELLAATLDEVAAAREAEEAARDQLYRAVPIASLLPPADADAREPDLLADAAEADEDEEDWPW